MTHALRSVVCSSKPSPRLLKALAPFSLVVKQAPSDAHISNNVSAAAALHTSRESCEHLRQLTTMPGSTIALLQGQSGCGKSTLLHALKATLGTTRARILDANGCLQQAKPHTPIVDLFSTPIAATLKLLSMAGLGEAMLWARAPNELSEGQRARLTIALAMARASRPRPTWILLDEFCSTLDRVTARCVARTLRRWSLQARHVRIVCATAHDDISSPLEPDLIIEPHAQQETA